jgi:hypothetical protein
MKATVRGSHTDDDFASGVSLFKVPEGISNLTQGVAPTFDPFQLSSGG